MFGDAGSYVDAWNLIMGTAKVPAPKLPIKVSAPVKANKGKAFTYKVTITNNQDATISNLGFRMALPAGTSFLASSLTPKMFTGGVPAPQAKGPRWAINRCFARKLNRKTGKPNTGCECRGLLIPPAHSASQREHTMTSDPNLSVICMGRK